jgi:peptidoglycan-associated lipoprotein
MRKLSVLGICVVLVCLALAAGCSKKPVHSVPGATAGSGQGADGYGSGQGVGSYGLGDQGQGAGGTGFGSDQGEFMGNRPMTPQEEAAARQIQMNKIYFEFDSNELTTVSQSILRNVAEIMRGNPGLVVLVEGHTDERGTNEYNLALGERRARAVQDYLTLLGIEPVRLSIVSFGEEKPDVDGHGEAAWAKNRRAEFNVGPKI